MPNKPTLKYRIGKRLAQLLIAFLILTILPVIIFRWLPLPTSSVMLQRTLTEQASQHYQWVNKDQISAWAAMAVIAAEDQKFPDHHGVDFKAVSDAISDRLEGKRLRGASTISQQVAKNVFLWQGRSFVRKGLEVYFTGLIELIWPKKRILEVYLNVAEMGPKTFGIAAASQRYFGKTPKHLTAEESALIAAVLPNPILMRVDQPSAHVLKRQRWIRKQMRQLGNVEFLTTF